MDLKNLTTRLYTLKIAVLVIGVITRSYRKNSNKRLNKKDNK